MLASHDGMFETYTTLDGLSNDVVTALYEDESSLWIGTNGGVSRRNRASGGFDRLTEKEGLNNNSVASVTG